MTSTLAYTGVKVSLPSSKKGIETLNAGFRIKNEDKFKRNCDSKVICEKWKYWDGLSRYDSRPQV